MDALEINLAKHYGDPGEDTWILNSSNDQVMLNHPLLEARGIDRCDMARFVAEQCATDPGLTKAVAACDAPAMAAIDPMVARLVLGHRPGYSGDVFLVPQPGWINYGRTGTTHGSTFPHDTHVPALFLGAGVPHGETFSRTTSVTSLQPLPKSWEAPTPTARLANRFPTCSTWDLDEHRSMQTAAGHC